SFIVIWRAFSRAFSLLAQFEFVLQSGRLRGLAEKTQPLRGVVFSNELCSRPCSRVFFVTVSLCDPSQTRTKASATITIGSTTPDVCQSLSLAPKSVVMPFWEALWQLNSAPSEAKPLINK
ncbi:MAG: hypothetical protein WBV41_12085, partial [Terriglobales bacterium]